MISLRIVALLMCFLVLGCSDIIDIRGYNPEDLDLKKIHVGKDTHEDIKRHMGTPTLVSLFGPTIWYYTFKKTSTTSFYHPKTLEQKTMIIEFDAKGVVKSARIEDGEISIKLDPDCTSIKGHESGAIKDVFGNFRKYSNKSEKKPT